jgi:hypothetical protein
MQEWRLAISGSPILENNATRPGPNSIIFTVFCKIWKTRQRCNCLKEWSGLSESNRHLNLGKVREVKSNALERRHLAFWGHGLNWKTMENESRKEFSRSHSNQGKCASRIPMAAKITP